MGRPAGGLGTIDVCIANDRVIPAGACETGLPLEALWSLAMQGSIEPKPGLKVAFNLTVYRSEEQVWRCWEGTLAETWRLSEAGTLQLK